MREKLKAKQDTRGMNKKGNEKGKTHTGRGEKSLLPPAFITSNFFISNIVLHVTILHSNKKAGEKMILTSASISYYSLEAEEPDLSFS